MAKMTAKVHIISDADRLGVRTIGWEHHGQGNIRVRVNGPDLLSPAHTLLENLVSYTRETGRKLVHESTISYGFLTLKLVQGTDTIFDVWEYRITPKTEEGWHQGASQTLQFWVGFQELCTSLGAEWDPPHGTYFGFVSNGVVEGRVPVEGVRFASKPPDSGWIFTTDLYDGDIRTLRKIELNDLVQAQPGLGRVVGLPKGYYFRIGHTAEESGIWFDQEIAKAVPK